MKKKLEALLQDGRLAGNAAFAQVNAACQSAQSNFLGAKSEKASAKAAYRNANEADKTERMVLRTSFKQAKHLQRYHKAALELAEYRLKTWLESWVSQNPVPHEATSKNTKKPRVKAPVANALPAPATSPKPKRTRRVSEKTV